MKLNSLKAERDNQMSQKVDAYMAHEVQKHGKRLHHIDDNLSDDRRTLAESSARPERAHQLSTITFTHRLMAQQ